QRLSSGLRINNARDDAAGLAIAERLGAAVTGLNRAGKNANDAISLLQVADGAVGQVVGNLQRIRELAVQAANGSNSGSDRQALQGEADALVAANFQFADQTSFNHVALLDGSFADQFQIGPNSGDTLALAIPTLFDRRQGRLGPVDLPLRQVNSTSAVTGALLAGALTINGAPVAPSVLGAQPGQSSASAFAVAAAVNNAGVANLVASASNSISATPTGAANLAIGALSVNGVALGAISGATPAQVAASAAAAFTAAGAASGVSASAAGAVLSLSTADGRDIALSESAGGAAAALGLVTSAYHGSLTLVSTPAPTGGFTVGGSNPGAAGLLAGAQAQVDTGGTVTVLQSIGAASEPRIDLSSLAGATDALGYLDAKIDSSNALRALLGATQKRLEAVVGGILDSASNLSAARARIRDTDYASETAQLTRGQILQDAGIAIVAQANAQPRQALQLLR
ncbi:MAG: flagellin, partial [Pseudomonadota bacterium]